MTKNWRYPSKTAGFTLIELAIIVALIGILATIAISAYGRFVARTRQTEAKIAISAAYTAEQSFFAENGSYTDCLAQAGFGRPLGSRRYYFVGFMAAPDSTCGPNGTEDCCSYSWSPNRPCDCSCATFDTGGNDAGYGANTKASSTAVLINTCANQQTAGVPMSWTPHKSSFILGASGNITNSPVYDHWQIDDNKALTNIQSGL